MSRGSMLQDAAGAAIDTLSRSRPGWDQMTIEALQAEFQIESVMPIANRSDMIRAAALAIYIAERMADG